MSNLQKTLDALKPYVISIRYVEGVQVVDAIFKDGWVVPDSKLISKAKGDNSVNYYMIYSEDESVGIDDLLEFVSLTIKANVEREKKHLLLKQTYDKLKDIFAKNSLSRLNTLKFTFSDDFESPELSDIKLEEIITPTVKEEIKIEPIIAPTAKEEIIENTDGLSEDELEIIAEEKRGERNRYLIKKQQEQKVQIKSSQKASTKIELPPKKVGKLQSTIDSLDDLVEPTCNCGPNEACSDCIEKKDY
jgi:hypothetical protein